MGTPVSKKNKAEVSDSPKTSSSDEREKPAFIKEIVGLTNEKSTSFNPAGKLMFLVKFSNGKHELIENKDLRDKCPQMLIDYYEARMMWTDMNESFEKSCF